MIESTSHEQTSGAPIKNEPDDLRAQKGVMKNIGLPGQGSKSHLDEVPAIIPPARQPSLEEETEEEKDQDAAQDSLTEAVMENLRVGVGAAHEIKPEINSAAERKSNLP